MVTEQEMAAEQERIYESPSLRDDLNDEEATRLLQWGEGQVERMAQDFPDDFEQQCRFLRQLIKNINRFVGQREFNDEAGQRKYMGKAAMYLPKLGWESVTEDDLMATLPDDATDMRANLEAILALLTPQAPASDAATNAPPPAPEATSTAQQPSGNNHEKTEALPTPHEIATHFDKDDAYSINQADKPDTNFSSSGDTDE